LINLANTELRATSQSQIRLKKRSAPKPPPFRAGAHKSALQNTVPRAKTGRIKQKKRTALGAVLEKRGVSMEALVLFSHGSLLCGAGEALDAHAARLRARGEFPLVEVGYMNYSEPTFAQAVAKCRAAGATHIRVLPFFLVPGYFVTTTLPKHIKQARLDFPDITFTVADALGTDERLADALLDSARAPLPLGEWRGDLASAARGCRARPDCPLYATPNCPRVPAPNTPARPSVE